jgi:site-specific DNA-methyltransferase (adenine-specific)
MIKINKIYNEPCLETLKKMSDKSIDCVITSPPYWQLRDYGYDGQWGLEPTFQEYLEHLWQMMDEIYRVLKDEGTCWINLGDTYARGTRAKYAHSNQSLRSKHEHLIEPNTKPNYEGLDKCLLLIPHRFAIGCIDRGWIVRNDIIWAKRNGMPESVIDRFTKKHEYIFFMVKSEKYYFNLDAIRGKHKEVSINRNKYKLSSYNEENASRNREMKAGELLNDKGKNPGSVTDFWDITTKSSSTKHYASYNIDLIKKPILAGCPENGIIYDPFMGSGTTAVAAINSDRNFIGSEMSEEYIKICDANIKPLLQRIKLF